MRGMWFVAPRFYAHLCCAKLRTLRFDGGQVRLKESRKLSKNKAHYVDAILRREDRTIDIPEPYPNAHRLVEDFVQDKTLKHKESAPEDSAPAA